MNLKNEVMMGVNNFILGGKSDFVIYQDANGKEDSARYSLRVSKDGKSYFVYANCSGRLNYQGYIKRNGEGYKFYAGKNGMNETKYVKALMWVLKHSENMDDRVHVLHMGRCSVCGRKLKTVESLACGIGPKCLEKVIKVGGMEWEQN